jgi:hypothetical protein
MPNEFALLLRSAYYSHMAVTTVAASPPASGTPELWVPARQILQGRAVARGRTGPRAGPGSPLDRSPRQRPVRGPDYYFRPILTFWN